MEGRDAGLAAVLAELQAFRQEDRLEKAASHAETNAKIELLQREMMALSASVKLAFPGGDFEGHRRYHELLIEREELKRSFWQGLLVHIAKASAWAAVVGVFFYLVRSA